ncbi:MAG TPA: single-stranded DNA-binding protein [Candidatus Altiarchaeales archaeon]|nr:single-stranded DNA-binding protein [Candidatus Altiarchaeales archaeon]
MARNIEMKCSELRPKMKNIKITFKVVSTDEAHEVKGKSDNTKHHVMDAVVGDETGMITLTLWDDDIEKISLGKTYELTNGYAGVFKGQMRLNIGKYGSLTEVEDPEFKVDESKNFSEEVHEKYDRRNQGRRQLYGSGSFWPG